MITVTVWNKGKRTFPRIVNSMGKHEDLGPNESIIMEERIGLRFVASYPRELTTVKDAPAQDKESLKRLEQSVNDRRTALDDREKSIAAREVELAKREAKVEDREMKVADREAAVKGKRGSKTTSKDAD